MDKQILNIINNSDEAVYELDAYLASFKSSKLKENIWNDLKNISLKGDLNQRFVALTIISVNKPSYMEELSYELIDNYDFVKDEYILKPIINMCATIQKQNHLFFLMNSLRYLRETKNEYLYEVVLSNVITTKKWEIAIDEIAEYLLKAKNIAQIDMLAFFIKEQGKDQFKKLQKNLPKECQDKITFLYPKILGRYSIAYKD
jgi:hypothetical protein